MVEINVVEPPELILAPGESKRDAVLSSSYHEDEQGNTYVLRAQDDLVQQQRRIGWGAGWHSRQDQVDSVLAQLGSTRDLLRTASGERDQLRSRLQAQAGEPIARLTRHLDPRQDEIDGELSKLRVRCGALEEEVAQLRDWRESVVRAFSKGVL